MISDELRKHVDVPGGKISGEITMAPEEHADSLQACRACKSRDIENLELVSHSMSKDDMMALYDTIKDFGDFKNILDIGSRSGCVVMAGALLLPKTEKLI